jgi:glycosyltransferase involved in cell wall biosynthesis
MSKHNNSDISIVIPALNAEEWLPALLKCIEAQTLLPNEIIIVDSSPTNRTSNIISNWNGPVLINYQRIGFAYPGHARNIGVKAAKCKWIAFIDCRTLPEIDWLEKCSNAANENIADIVIASRVSEADTYFKRVLRAATSGCAVHKSLAGSFVLKDFFEQSGGFISDIRAGEDIEWMQRIDSLGARNVYVTAPVVKYNGLPKNLMVAMMKWHRYAMSKIHHDIRNDQKKLYFLILIFVSFMFIKKWNAIFARWDINSIYYIPNITKIFFAILVFGYIFYRGIIRPLEVKVKFSYLLPWRWLEVSFVGLCLDFAKAPGLIFGALLLVYRRVAGLERYLRTRKKEKL